MVREIRKASLKIRAKVADNLRHLRKTRGWTQEQLANETGLQKAYIGDVEQANVNITLARLETLANGLQCTVAELLGQQRVVRRNTNLISTGPMPCRPARNTAGRDQHCYRQGKDPRPLEAGNRAITLLFPTL